MWTNYKLTRLLIAKTGVIYGQNQFGSEWLELRWRGTNIKTLYLKNNNPIKPIVHIEKEVLAHVHETSLQG